MLNLIDMLGAGILTLHDILNMNRTIKRDEIRNFFVLMEVYGAQCSTERENFFVDSGLDDTDLEEGKKHNVKNKSVLSQLRLLSLDQLT